ncbi:hypothetical protein [Shewanella sp. YIC-542]|uniref:hypothetical protein n=1 Tax=Shewanella mytili TaxID=3377111 RepID=UPI00398E3739
MAEHKGAGHTTAYQLGLFLLLLLLVVLSALSWQFYQKNQALQQQVLQLQDAQVVLMVPDEQAATIADWMVAHPEQTAALLDVVKPAQTGEKSLQQVLDEQQRHEGKTPPQQANRPVAADGKSLSVPESPNAPVMVEQLQDGVKVIRLPHGGIRVTTRDVNEE